MPRPLDAPPGAAAIVALSLLTGCFEGIPLVAAPDAGGLGRCLDGQSGTFSVPGCFTAHTAPAAVRGVVHNPHAGGLDPRQFVPGPPVVIDGVPIVPEPQYAIPAEPFITYAVGADGCRGACSTAVGIVDFAWSAQVLPALLAQGAYPRLALVDVGCGILPRPVCDGAPQRYAQDYAALMDSAGYIRSALGYSPTAAACREGICLAALGLQLADLCARANTWRWDADRDGAGDGCDNCVAAANPGQADRDGDGWGDQCDPCPEDFSPLASQDADGDGHVDCADNCRDRPNPDQRDTDDDGAGNSCDDDDDGDGLSDLEEDWVGTRRLDPDTDGDGQPDGADVCPLVADVAQRDTDGDGAGNACDADDDDDGLSDEAEAEAGTDPLDRDTDGDGHEDGADNCPLDENPGQEEADDPSNGQGDACDLPLPPEEHHPDAPPSADQLVWIDMVRADSPEAVPWALLNLPLGLVATAAESYFDGPMLINQPPADPEPDQPPARRRRGWHIVEEVVGRLAAELEDATGHTIGIILGRAYEQWAGNTYCHSNPHAIAFAELGEDPALACRREVAIPRTTHDFDDPQPLIGTMKRRLSSGEIRTYRFERKRRHDCHCRGVEGVIAPLSEEYKASRSVRDRYRRRYHRWLVAQCKDYRFTLARLTHEAFPHAGSLRDTYQKLTTSTRLGRPSLLYRLLRETGAMRAVLAECRFAEFADDAGVMPEAEVARRRLARPEERWSQSQSRVSVPGWRSPPDAVRGCEGGVVQHYLAKGCPVRPGVAAPPGLGRCEDGERRWGIYTRCTVGFDVAEDPFVRHPVWADFQTGASGPRLPVLNTPICPPRWMNAHTALIWEEMVDIDRLRSRIDAEGFEEFFGHFLSMHWWGFPIWIGASPGGDIVQMVQRGQWVIAHEDVFMDFGLQRMGRNGDPLSAIDAPFPIYDGVAGIPELEVDPDEARDACFD